MAVTEAKFALTQYRQVVESSPPENKTTAFWCFVSDMIFVLSLLKVLNSITKYGGLSVDFCNDNVDAKSAMLINGVNFYLKIFDKPC